LPVISATWELDVGGWWSETRSQQKAETLFEK
jgi:hypothetical protein